MFAEAFFVKYFDLARANDMYIFLAPSTYLAFGLLVNFRMTGRGGAKCRRGIRYAHHSAEGKSEQRRGQCISSAQTVFLLPH